MKPLAMWWQQWLLGWGERLRSAAQHSSWEPEDLPQRPDPLGWGKEAKAVVEELEQI